jgi:hypothetical protein
MRFFENWMPGTFGPDLGALVGGMFPWSISQVARSITNNDDNFISVALHGKLFGAFQEEERVTPSPYQLPLSILDKEKFRSVLESRVVTFVVYAALI